ncbi:MAG: LicD family protein [Cytophagales bacterium]|nr:LicD family protein [Cytophagales bacterium]
MNPSQSRMLEILIDIDSICIKNGINYWITSGTLLGAYRKGEFIPWDDDIDVHILHQDVPKLKQILCSDFKGKYIWHDNITDKNFYKFYSKIRDINSTSQEIGGEKWAFNGLAIDVFPIEKIPSIFLKRVIDKLLNILLMAQINSCFKNIFMFLIYIIIRVIRYFSKIYFCGYTYSYGIPYYFTYPSEDIFPLGKIRFENRLFSCPAKVENCLIENFGVDFKVPHTESQRETHLVAYKLLINLIILTFLLFEF